MTEQSDVFALSAVLYEAATGRCAFGREGVLDTLLAIASGDPVPPSRRIRSCGGVRRFSSCRRSPKTRSDGSQPLQV